MLGITPNSRIVRFHEEDLALFSKTSSDRNPLHLSTGYARRTLYGERVVFGALDAVACLGQIPVSSGHQIAHLAEPDTPPLPGDEIEAPQFEHAVARVLSSAEIAP